jgi:hypothetical protein
MKSTSDLFHASMKLGAALLLLSSAAAACGDGDAGAGGGGAGGKGGGAGGGNGGSSAAPLPVNLATAGDFVILAKTGISTVPTSAVTGNLGVSPAAATFITGWALTADATNVFSTSLADRQAYTTPTTAPTPTSLTTAVGMRAFTGTAGARQRPELGAGDIGGMTLAPGVYKWGTGVLIPTDVTLNGPATGVWIFQIAQDLTMASGTKIVLAGGALPRNVFWQVAGLVDLGTTAHGEGVV